MLAKIRDVNSLGTVGQSFRYHGRPSRLKTYPIYLEPRTPPTPKQMVSQSQASACLSVATISRLRRRSGSLVDVRDVRSWECHMVFRSHLNHEHCSSCQPVARSFVGVETLPPEGRTSPSNGSKMYYRHVLHLFLTKTSVPGWVHRACGDRAWQCMAAPAHEFT